MNVFIVTKKNILLFSLFILLFIIGCFSLSKNKTLETAITITSENDLQILLNSNYKIAYLTFDDGPTEKMTPKILDILDEEEIPATFFVVGKHVKEHPELVKRAYDSGHYIANHTYSHNNNKIYQSTESFINEITSTDEAISEALGIKDYCSHVFRFPEGYMTNKYKAQKEKGLLALKELDYVYVDWNCLNKDSETKCSNNQLINNLIKSSKNKTSLVVLMHDTGDVNNTNEVLKTSIEYLKNKGYEFRNFYDFFN
mgnify:FL=1